MISEITPSDDGSLPIIEYSSLFHGLNLHPKIHTFFDKHIEKSLKNSKLKNFKFSNYNSTIYSASRGMLGVDENDRAEEEIFEMNSKIIIKKLAENIHKNVTNPFLFIVFTAKHQITENVNEELLCLMKMDRFEGVQFSNNNFELQPDMLPDVRTDLQKCAFIYKSKISDLTIENFEEDQIASLEEDNPNDDYSSFHSSILDKQDESISKYFMISFMESYIIARDKEVTKLAQKHITTVLSKYINADSTRKDVKNYIDNELQKRKQTSVKLLVEEVMNNSGYINQELLLSNNLDVDSISAIVFNNMKTENISAYQEFVSIPEIIERTTFRDIENDGRDIRIHIAKMYEESGDVIIDREDSEYLTIKIKKDKIVEKEG